MSKFPRMAFGMIAALAAAPVFADAPQGAGSAAPDAEPAPKTERVQRVGSRLDVIVVHGAVDREHRRWAHSGKSNPVLPKVSESAFLDGEAADSDRPR